MSSRFVDSLQLRADELLPTPVARYVRQGARDGVSADEAVAAWDAFRLLPQVLRDVTQVDLTTSVLGTALRTPIGVAPTTMQRAAHPGGEVAMARAVAASGSLLVMSSNAGSTFEEVAASGVDWWLQMYVTADRPTCLPLLRRAAAAGARAVVLTVDTPVVGTKYATPGTDVVWDTVDPALLRVNFEPGYDAQPGAEKALDLGPHDIGWLADRTGLPVVVKGVLRPEDALRAVQAGAAGVWVSNHGGRQLDRAASTASCLPAVVAAVGDRAQVYVDGGLRTGLDVLAALALGADAVFFGRSPLLALIDGAPGVARWHAAMLVESVDALRLAGCRTAADTRGLAVVSDRNRL